MNLFKRAAGHMLYKKGYNLILILLFLVLGTLILSGFAINSASGQACAQVRRELGGSVRVINRIKLLDGFLLEDAKKAAALGHVKASNFTNDVSAYAYDFKAVGDPLSGMKDKAAKPTEDVGLNGITASALLSDFTQGGYKLTSGRHLTAGDVGKMNALIEQSLADQNKLRVGDKIGVEAVTGGKQRLTLEIVGIYKNPGQSSAMGGPSSMAENQIFLPYTAVSQLTGSTNLNIAEYVLDDPLNIDGFKKSAEKLLGDDYQVDAHDYEYQNMAGSIANLQTISNATVAGVIIMGVVILSLIVLLNLKSRNYEIGVLLSVGEKKLRIMLQMLIETLVPVLIAVTLSIAAGRFAAQQIGNVMMASQEQNAGTSSGDTVKDAATGQTYEKVGTITVGITGTQILWLYIAGTLITLVASVSQIAFVVRCSPKKILLEIE